jgi:hypothetical protein
MTDCFCCDQCQRCPSLSLFEWFEYLCFTPYAAFQQAQDVHQHPATPIPCNSVEPCMGLVYNSITQGGHHPGRNEIYRAILHADNVFYDFTGYWPAPTYSCDEMAFKFGYMCGRLRLKGSKIKKLGRETLSLLQAVPVSSTDIADENGDGVWDTVTVHVPVVSSVNSDELAVFFDQTDWPKGSDRCRNEIRPIQVQSEDGPSGPEWVISWPSAVFIEPKLYLGMSQECIDPQDPTNYPVTVDLYRRWYDASQAITVMRKPDTCVCGQEASCYCCENASACIVDADAGIVELDLLGSDCCSTCAQKLCINYLAGDCKDNNAEMLAHYVAALIGRNVCCADNPCVKYWQEEFVAVNARGNISTPLSQVEQSNPFGTRRGAVELYRFLRGRRSVRALRI